MLFMFLLTTDFSKNIRTYGRIFFVFLKIVLNQTWNAFKTKFGRQ